MLEAAELFGMTNSIYLARNYGRMAMPKKALIEELKIGEKSGKEQGYIDMKESKSRLGL